MLRLVVFLLIASLQTQARAHPVELAYGLEVKIRSMKVDADLWSGARLSMEATPTPDGTRLTLLRPVEHPWKFFWVNPVFGSSEVKFASEVTLPAPSWPARMNVEGDVDRTGRAVWRRWQREWGGTAPFENAFAFFIIGAPRGRFVVEISRNGAVGSVVNRMTHRWLPTGFKDWEAGKPVEGYGFWADDPVPPEWQPNTWAALSEAVRLFSAPVARGEVVHQDLLGGARRVLETLVPRVKGLTDGAADLVLAMSEREENGGYLLEGESAPVRSHGISIVLKRRTRLDSERRPLADAMQVSLRRGDALEMKLDVSWAPSL